MTYARETSVPVGRSQDEIKRVLTRYGATGFMFGETDGKALCAFEMKQRRVKFLIGVPQYGKAKNKKGWILSRESCEQNTRTAWRCLLLAIKAKLECVESEISTFESEFLAHIVMPDGQTIGQAVIPQIGDAYSTGKMPPLLLGGRP